ncbi:MAG: response regulator [Candidatus Omnitrophica bacterium]|nr:response regulator [Candidatus Omnitrophota bacterium]
MSKKILVVDDDPVVVKLVSATLQKEGYEVLTASDGLDAMVLIDKEKPDLLVLDIMLPEINGYDICYNLRFDEHFPPLPVVLISSCEPVMHEMVFRRTNIYFMGKPINTKLLLEKIHLMLSVR